MADALYATLKTNQGDIEVKLFPDHAPKTVKNFTELALGAREWTDPKTGSKTTARLYDGTVFHRVISGFMIQGGDPLGTGMGGPGYKFADEFHPELQFDRPYLLAMANAGPGHQRLAVLHHRRPDAPPQPEAHDLRRGGRWREPRDRRPHRAAPTGQMDRPGRRRRDRVGRHRPALRVTPSQCRP